MDLFLSDNTSEEYVELINGLDENEREAYNRFISTMVTVTDPNEKELLKGAMEGATPMIKGDRYHPVIFWVDDTIFGYTQSGNYFKVVGGDVTESDNELFVDTKTLVELIKCLDDNQRKAYNRLLSNMVRVESPEEIDILRHTIEHGPPMLQGDEHHPAIFWANDTVFGYSKADVFFKEKGHDILGDLDV